MLDDEMSVEVIYQFICRKVPLNGEWLNVSLNYQRSVASLQCDGQALEELFNFVRIVFAPSPGTLSRQVLQAFDSIAVPATERLDYNWHEDDPFRAAMVEVGAILCSLSHLDRSCREIGGAMNDGVLCGRYDADV